MSLCLAYLFRFWRMKAFLLGLCCLTLLFVACVHLTGHRTFSMSKYDQPAAVVGKAFRSTQKRLQHSDDDDGGSSSKRVHTVRFFPRKKSQQRIPTNAHHQEAAAVPDTRKYPLLNSPFREDVMKARIPQPSMSGNVEYAVYDVAMSDHMIAPKMARGDQPVEEEPQELPLFIPQRRIVHLDLKGAPPKLNFLVKLLKWIAERGATGILLEYEDMFPFKGLLASVAASNHYDQADIQTLLSVCRKLKLDVIPLIQTFGHMEFILKHDKFSHLRDMPEMPESICACHNDTMPLIKEYVDQVVSAHSQSEFVHIGCDEVYHLGGCPACQGMPRTNLFIDHVVRVASYIKEVYKKKVIIWDDMLRGFVSAEMSPLSDVVEPMVWVYAEEPYHFMPNYNWDRLAEIFPTAWTASAFKGADGPTAVLPNIQKRLTNHLNWLHLMAEEQNKFSEGFRGMAITGWQRYDHFAVLCELLPAAVPSLAIMLEVTENGFFNETLKNDFFKKMECGENTMASQDFLNFDTDPFLWNQLAWCFFPGAQFFKLTSNYENVKNEVQDYIQRIYSKQGWMTEYNFRRNYSSPMRLSEGLDDFARLHFSVTHIIQHTRTALAEIYDEYTIAEWIEQKLLPLVNSLVMLKNQTEVLKSHHYWSRRPLPILPELKEFGLGLNTHPSSTSPPLASSNHAKGFSQVPANMVRQLPVSARLDQDQMITIRPKRLVQAPDYYRHPPGSF